MNTETKDKPIRAIPLPIDIIREALELDPTSDTGLRWKKRPREHFATERGWIIANAQNSGKPAGSLVNFKNGQYWQVRINYRLYLVHRVVYFLAHGVDPNEMLIDHADGNGLNNNPLNLRLATYSQNLQNQRLRSDSTSGFKGASWNSSTRKWQAYINKRGIRYQLGNFPSPEEAHAAYARAAAELHGEFHRVA